MTDGKQIANLIPRAGLGSVCKHWADSTDTSELWWCKAATEGRSSCISPAWKVIISVNFYFHFNMLLVSIYSKPSLFSLFFFFFYF